MNEESTWGEVMEALSTPLLAYYPYEKFVVSYVVGRPFEMVTAIAWMLVGIGAIWATFSPLIRDSVWERIALACVSLGAFSRAFYVANMGVVPLDAMFSAVAVAFYCIVIYAKHQLARRRKRRRCTDKYRHILEMPRRRKDDMWLPPGNKASHENEVKALTDDDRLKR
jgi:hypothetical protein